MVAGQLLISLLYAWFSITGILLATAGDLVLAALHATILIALLYIAKHPEPSASQLTVLAPLMIITGYNSLDPAAKTLHTATFDPLIQEINHLVFNHSFWTTAYQTTPTILGELLVFAYLSYYLLLAVALMKAYTDQKTLFILLTALFSCYTLFILFPVGGPLRQTTLHDTGMFSSILKSLYQPTLSDGVFTAAFPSSHVAIAVVITRLLGHRLWQTLLLGSLTALIAIATIYTQTHYAIDALLGIPTGILLYEAWANIYDYYDDTAAIRETTRS